MKLSIGQVLKGKNRSDAKVLQITESEVAINFWVDSDTVIHWLTLEELQERYEVPKETIKRYNGIVYWAIDGVGEVYKFTWTGCDLDKQKQSFLGVYDTEAEALAAAEKIKELLSNLKQ